MFNGDPLDYPSFMAIFDETIATKVSDNQIKLSRLLQYTSGSAYSAIKNCSLIGGNEGYAKAREILQTRFGNEFLVSERIIKNLKQNDKIRNCNDLQQLADDLTMAQAALSKLNKLHVVDNQQTILDVPNSLRVSGGQKHLIVNMTKTSILILLILLNSYLGRPGPGLTRFMVRICQRQGTNKLLRVIPYLIFQNSIRNGLGPIIRGL